MHFTVILDWVPTKVKEVGEGFKKKELGTLNTYNLFKGIASRSLSVLSA